METNEKLKKQAGDLLQHYEALNGIASVTGSCALDLMLCPDLDLYVPADQVKSLFRLGVQWSAASKFLHSSFNTLRRPLTPCVRVLAR